MTALGGFLLYARFPVGSAGTELLEEALAALSPGDSALRSHLLAHLALEMWSGFEPVERRVAISEEAREMLSLRHTLPLIRATRQPEAALAPLC